MKTLLFIILFFANSAWAQIQVTDVNYASGYDLGATATSVPEIYGGISGPSCSGLGSSEYCNSCTTADTSCNRKRIHNDLELEIKFKVTGDISGEIIVGYGASNADNVLNSNFYTKTSGSLSKNSTGTIKIPWGRICNMFIDVHGSNATDPNTVPCESAFTTGTTILATSKISLFIVLGTDVEDEDQGIKATIQLVEPDFDPCVGCDGPGLYNPTVLDADSPDVGLDSFVAVPGDEKIYIDQLDPSSECPDTTTSEVKKFRIFYSATNFADANYPSSNYKDFKIDDNCDPSGDWVIDGLSNGTYYHVRAAILDGAENVAFLTDDSIYSTAGCAATIANDTDDAACVYAAKPDNVLGLLNEDFNCFIATATFGSGFHTFVRTLREFRNERLLPHRWGRDFIRWYYKVGPGWAKWISDKPSVKTAVGVILTPITGFAWFSVYYGLTGTILTSLCIIFALGYYSLQFRQHRASVKINRQNQDIHHD